jgi:hypothetical protein
VCAQTVSLTSTMAAEIPNAHSTSPGRGQPAVPTTGAIRL